MTKQHVGQDSILRADWQSAHSPKTLGIGGAGSFAGHRRLTP